MLNIEAKYEQLKLMLNLNCYGYSEFEDDLTGKYFLIDSKRPFYGIGVYIEGDTLEIVVEEKDIEWDEWYEVERKYYKTAKGAFNKLMKLLN